MNNTNTYIYISSCHWHSVSELHMPVTLAGSDLYPPQLESPLSDHHHWGLCNVGNKMGNKIWTPRETEISIDKWCVIQPCYLYCNLFSVSFFFQENKILNSVPQTNHSSEWVSWAFHGLAGCRFLGPAFPQRSWWFWCPGGISGCLQNPWEIGIV